MWANIALDVLLIAVMLIGIIVGYKKGFISVFFRKLSWLGALVLSFLFSRPIANSIHLADKVADPVKQNLTAAIGGHVDNLEEMSGRIPTVLKLLGQLFGVDLTAMADSSMQEGGNYVETFVEKASEPLSNAIATVAVFVISFFAFWFLIWLVGKLINVVFKLPVLKQINGILGALLSLFFCSLFLWVFCKLAVFVIDYTGGVSFLNGFDIDSTYIGKFLYHLDPLKLLLSF